MPHDQLTNLEFFFQKAPFGLCVLDRELRYVRINEFLARINRKTVQEHLGRFLGEIASELNRKMRPFFQQAIDTGEPVIDIEIQTAEKSEPSIQKCWLTSFYPVMGKDRLAAGICAVLRDITERKEAEQRLIEEKQFSDTVIESLPGLFFMLDEKGRYVRWNKNAVTVYGYSADEMTRLDGWKDTVIPEDLNRLMEATKRAFQGGSGYCEYSLVTKDNRKITYAGDARCVTIRGEKYLVGMEIDITKRTKAVDALKKALSEIKRLKNQLQADNIYLLEQIRLEQGFDEIVGESHALKQVLLKVKQVASSDATVLILGETGTGKELVARSIHSTSSRKDRPLVKVDCTTLPFNLIESELFGYEKGAFTGAQARKAGRFEVANGSTIFLDEIGELPLDTQGKLLRVIQDGEFERLGGTRTIKVDVRIIAATNRDLEKEVNDGRFRKDLWYRINVFPITVPGLRERKQDIALLINFFITKFSRELGKSIRKIPQKTMEALQEYAWPGNVRELKNIIERAVISTRGSVLCLSDRLENCNMANPATTPRKKLEEIERDYIVSTLEETNWKIAGKNGAAEILGLNPSTLRGRLRKLGIYRKSHVAQF